MKKKKMLLSIGIVISIAFLFIIYCHFENTTIETTEITISSSRIPDNFNGYKILQISDLHNAEFGNENKSLLDKIKKFKPDIIVITGDLVDSSKTNIDVAIKFVEQAIQIAPIYYVTGNHEAYVGEYTSLLETMTGFGVHMMDNKYETIQRDESAINIAGFADPAFVDDFEMDSFAIFNKYFEEMNLDLSNYTVLLSHRPEVFNYYAKKDFDLVLSGHAHGGQIRLPFIGGLIAPNQGIFPDYTSGIYENDGTKMIVSRGLGNSIIPVRINNNPEIVIVTLENQKITE